MNRKLLAALCAVWIVLMPNMALAQATQKSNGQIQTDGGLYYGVGYWNGTSWMAGKADANGIGRFTEEYPFQLQNDAFPAADTTVTVFNGALRPIGLGWSVSPFGSRNVLITRVQSKDTRTLKLLWFGSDDNVNWYPVVSDNAWATNGDSTKVDTLQVTIPPTFANANTVRQFKIGIPESPFPGRYAQIWGYTQDSTVATSYQRVGLRYEGRWK